MIACAPITRGFDGGLRMLPGYLVHIVQPDKQGVGQLQVKGPGVFSGYLNARAAMSMDGYFVTGDRARMGRDGKLYVYERVEDLIISGGENIYPEEIREALLRIPGVKDAYVFGTADELWGYRPVAFIEPTIRLKPLQKTIRSWASIPKRRVSGLLLAHRNSRAIFTNTSSLICRTCITRSTFSCSSSSRRHLWVRSIASRSSVFTIGASISSRSRSIARASLQHAYQTPKREIDTRESFFVELEDWAGRTGIGECVSFTTNWYLPETLGDDYAITKDVISSIVMNERYLHPSEVSRSFATFPALANYPMAKTAVEPAVWICMASVGAPLWELIGGVRGKQVRGGTVIAS